MTYYEHDHLGNLRVAFTPVVDCSNPTGTEPDPLLNHPNSSFTLEQVVDYFPYGKILRQYVNSEGPERYLTTQHERDQETGLDYRGARYYDSDVARFLSLDPLAADYAGWSPYNYVMGNPISLIDPDGRSVGDYYKNGKWIASDGIADGKVYHADSQGDVTFGIGVLKDTQFKEWTYPVDAALQGYMPTLLSHEGGYVDDPHDRGGATNMGITLGTFKKFANNVLGVEPTKGNLQRLTESQAAAIYQVGYWQPSGASRIDDRQMAYQHLDTYINGGANSVLRSVLDQYSSAGGDRITQLNNIMLSQGAAEVFNNYRAERVCRFNQIVENNPSQHRFLNGWINRANRFQYR